jgi:hypothetical protein
VLQGTLKTLLATDEIVTVDNDIHWGDFLA